MIRHKYNLDGKCFDIEGPMTVQLPDSVIPETVLAYVKANYSNQFIVEWEKGLNDQEVQLSNNIELKFDLTGKFLRIDR